MRSRSSCWHDQPQDIGYVEIPVTRKLDLKDQMIVHWERRIGSLVWLVVVVVMEAGEQQRNNVFKTVDRS